MRFLFGTAFEYTLRTKLNLNPAFLIHTYQEKSTIFLTMMAGQSPVIVPVPSDITKTKIKCLNFERQDNDFLNRLLCSNLKFNPNKLSPISFKQIVKEYKYTPEKLDNDSFLIYRLKDPVLNLEESFMGSSVYIS